MGTKIFAVLSSSLIGSYVYLTERRNRNFDLRIIRTVQENGPMVSEEISGRVGKSLQKTESRLWDLYERQRVTHSNNNARHKSYWGPILPMRRT